MLGPPRRISTRILAFACHKLKTLATTPFLFLRSNLLSFPWKGLLTKSRLLRRPDESGLLAMTESAFLCHCEQSEAISNGECQVWQQTRKRALISALAVIQTFSHPGFRIKCGMTTHITRNSPLTLKLAPDARKKKPPADGLLRRGRSVPGGWQTAVNNYYWNLSE